MGKLIAVQFGEKDKVSLPEATKDKIALSEIVKVREKYGAERFDKLVKKLVDT